MNAEEKLKSIFEVPVFEGNPYNHILQMCVGHDDLRDWFNVPIQDEETAIATDARILVFFQKGLAENVKTDIASMAKCKRFIQKERNQNLIIPLDVIKEKLSLCAIGNDYNIIGKNIKCDACDGEGEVQVDFFYNRTYYELTAECPICNGNGLATHETKIPNGKLKFDGTELIQIGCSTFAVGYIHMIYQMAQVLNQDEIILVYQNNPNQNSIFRIGNIEVLLMPVSNFHNERTVCSIN